MMLYAIKSTINDRTESFCFITAIESLSFTETVSICLHGMTYTERFNSFPSMAKNCLTNTRIDYMAK